MAVGPTLGGLLISWTHNLLSVFLMAALFHGLYVILLLFVVPESLTKEMAKANAEIAKRRFEQEEARRAANPKPATAIRKAKHILRKAFFFLSPLSIFIPPKTRRGQGRSWNLTILAITYGLYSMLFVSTSDAHVTWVNNRIFRAHTSSNTSMQLTSSGGHPISSDTG